MRAVRPLNDYIFKKVFGEKGDEVQLLALLNAILSKNPEQKRLETIEIVENKEINPAVFNDKGSILDVRAVAVDGTKINIEVQLKDFHNMAKRSLYYWSREYSAGLDKGGTYENLPNVIVINIVDFAVVDVDIFHTTFRLREDTYRDCVLTDALEMHFIDVKKWSKLPKTDKNILNSLHRWLTFLDEKTPENILEDLISMDTAIQQANSKMNFILNDKENLRLYHMHEMAEVDWNSSVATAEAKGKAEGKAEVAIKLLKRNLSIEDIVEDTGLTISEIEKLKAEIE